VKGLKTDVTSEASVKAMVDAAVAFGGGHIDLLFNNAGLGLGGAFEEQGNEQWGKAFAINFYSVVYGVRAALPYMKAQKAGHIANTASGIVYVHLPSPEHVCSHQVGCAGSHHLAALRILGRRHPLSTVIPGTVATAIWAGGPIPKQAITSAESAAGILKGVAENQRVIFVTEDDRSGCLNMARAASDSQLAKWMDEYLLGVARARKSGNFSAI